MNYDEISKMADYISDLLEERDEVSVLDSDFNTWDAKKFGDRIHVICLDTQQALLIGAAWDDQDSLQEYEDGL